MLKKVSLFICFFTISSILLSSPTMASSQTLKKGFYKAGDLNLSPDTIYTIQNNSFSERIYILIFDSKATPLQGVRLKPQSPKFNLIPLQPGYKLVLIGEGELEISD
ncbi:hypothetical protein [Clostridium saccharoperbutylacetonicum]|uniref:hypothetical protein n=1 Tax=Clostridium saccharoperbutylacetonicum TaxID=36745 RepID=UPI000983C475|nr:hypothetical protein [Clostridium saccharoperbutylacetonicum]AQR96007.1 hypothetical protein CLSAP_33250 [Clostridium saccharoperbutylacetonicum]NSB31874.1 hypothetical protein [Clostridium saccharoperbutylacetonicum]